MTEIELFDRLNPRRDLPQATCDVISRVYEVMSKENALQWHDLRKNPKDLPACGNWILCYMNESYRDRYIVGIADEINDNEPFLVGYETDEANGFENVIAWQYLPKPPKEEWR